MVLGDVPVLLQLFYTSRSFGYDQAVLSGILLDARRCNIRDGITGALICREDLYLQLLEGPAALVDACFERIRADDRHLDIRLIVRRPTETRLFPEWAMHHDPAVSWMWSADEVAAGTVERASAAEAEAVFRRVAQAAAG